MHNPGNWTVGPDGTTVVSDYPAAGTVIASGLDPRDAPLVAAAPDALELLRLAARSQKWSRAEDAGQVVRRADGMAGLSRP